MYNNSLRKSQRDLLANSTAESQESIGGKSLQPKLPNVTIKPLPQTLQPETASQEKILDILQNTDYDVILNHDQCTNTDPVNIEIPTAVPSACTCKFRHKVRARLNASLNTDYDTK